MPILNRTGGKSAGLRTLASSIITRKQWKSIPAAGQIPRRRMGRLQVLAVALRTAWRHGNVVLADAQQVEPVPAPGYVMMAYPPSGGITVRPLGRDSSAGYERVSVRSDWITDESDLWAKNDDWLAGEYECVLSVERPDGTVFRTRDVVDLAVELHAFPAVYTSLRRAIAEEAMDTLSPGVLN